MFRPPLRLQQGRSRDRVEVGRARQLHGDPQFLGKAGIGSFHASASCQSQRIERGAAQSYGTGPIGQGLEHVLPAPHAAIDNDRHFAAGLCGDGAKDAVGCRSPVELRPTVTSTVWTTAVYPAALARCSNSRVIPSSCCW